VATYAGGNLAGNIPLQLHCASLTVYSNKRASDSSTIARPVYITHLRAHLQAARFMSSGSINERLIQTGIDRMSRIRKVNASAFILLISVYPC
jgi:hypothetical protein